MTHKEILEKAVYKALENGWYPSEKPSENKWEVSYINDHVVGLGNYKDSKTTRTIYYHLTPNIHEVIFNHDFARALWGDKVKATNIDNYDGSYYLKGYLHHLQQMVIADDPIKYLEENMG